MDCHSLLQGTSLTLPPQLVVTSHTKKCCLYLWMYVYMERFVMIKVSLFLAPEPREIQNPLSQWENSLPHCAIKMVRGRCYPQTLVIKGASLLVSREVTPASMCLDKQFFRT